MWGTSVAVHLKSVGAGRAAGRRMSRRWSVRARVERVCRMFSFVNSRRVAGVRRLPSRTSRVLAAAVAPVEPLEPRLFLHAGHDHGVVDTMLLSPQVAEAQLVSTTLRVTAASPFNG